MTPGRKETFEANGFEWLVSQAGDDLVYLYRRHRRELTDREPVFCGFDFVGDFASDEAARRYAEDPEIQGAPTDDL